MKIQLLHANDRLLVVSGDYSRKSTIAQNVFQAPPGGHYIAKAITALCEQGWTRPARCQRFVVYYFCRKCSRTFAAICGSVSLSTVSTLTMLSPKPLLIKRFLSSPLASPGPMMKMAGASCSCEITSS